jgi:hypothetical protein
MQVCLGAALSAVASVSRVTAWEASSNAATDVSHHIATDTACDDMERFTQCAEATPPASDARRTRHPAANCARVILKVLTRMTSSKMKRHVAFILGHGECAFGSSVTVAHVTLPCGAPPPGHLSL